MSLNLMATESVAKRRVVIALTLIPATFCAVFYGAQHAVRSLWADATLHWRTDRWPAS